MKDIKIYIGPKTQELCDYVLVSWLYQRIFIIDHLCLWYQGKDKNLAQFILSFTISRKLRRFGISIKDIVGWAELEGDKDDPFYCISKVPDSTAREIITAINKFEGYCAKMGDQTRSIK